MKHILFAMAIIGLAATGCAQNRVFSHQARRGGISGDLARVQQQKTQSKQQARQAAPEPMRLATSDFQQDSDLVQDGEIVPVGYAERCQRNAGGILSGKLLRKKDTCCGDDCCGGDCSVECGCGCADGGSCDCTLDSCCDAECGCADDCCDAGCGCADGCCSADGCCAEGYCAGGGCSGGSCIGGSCGAFSRGCSACGGRGCGVCQRMVGRVASGFCPHATGYPAAYNYNPSPPTGQVAYPYYTVRGPRDFLRNNPPSIGPY